MGILKKRWMDKIENDMNVDGVSKGEVALWRCGIEVADPIKLAAKGKEKKKVKKEYKMFLILYVYIILYVKIKN